MKIVNYEEFINLPEGTIYRQTHPMIFEELCIKQKVINDNSDWFLIPFSPFFQEEFFLEKAYEKLENQESLTLDMETQERDGLFDKNRKFLIYEKKDIQILIEKLKKSIDE